MRAENLQIKVKMELMRQTRYLTHVQPSSTQRTSYTSTHRNKTRARERERKSVAR